MYSPHIATFPILPDTYNLLVSHHIKPSTQRLAVMNYLRSTTSHPSAENVYDEVKNICPTLSKTTVYNTLKLFVKHKAALMLTIDETHAVFDACTTPHAHFYCTKCGKISDLPFEENKIQNLVQLPTGMKIDNLELSLRGTCACCATKE